MSTERALPRPVAFVRRRHVDLGRISSDLCPS